ncbi:serine hydrolase [Chryseobacterium indologenes]|uniref:Beta-lactamase n=1 Tax=Chryseobacterium indologenes TaxID=253 RepID=A0A0N0ZS89_CHRID|nr:serine hydrolase [Chryseobacterium indologenes]
MQRKASGSKITISSRIKEVVDSTMNKMIKKPLIHSASIGLVYKGREMTAHYGELEKGKNNTPDNETIYEIGSLSKTLTGMLVAKAVCEKKVDLDDDVQNYLIDNYPNLHFKGQPIRIKDLLSHTSGIPNMLPLEANTILQNFAAHDTPEKINTLYLNYGKKDFLNDLHQVKIDTLSGHKYAYSSAGTQLLASVVEKVYSRDFEMLLTDYLDENTEMKNTKINLKGQELKRLALGYHSDNPLPTSPMPLLPWGASGNVKSTVPDMLEYMRFQLKNDKVVAESHRTLVKFSPGFSIGYLWNIITDDKKLGTYYFHHGGVPRSQCYIYIIPQHQLGVFIITNQSGNDTALVMEEALREIFDKVIKI